MLIIYIGGKDNMNKILIDYIFSVQSLIDRINTTSIEPREREFINKRIQSVEKYEDILLQQEKPD